MSLSIPTTLFAAGVGVGTGMGLYAQHELAPFLSSEKDWIPLAAGMALGAVIGGMSALVTWPLKNHSPFKTWDYRKKAEEAFRPDYCTHTVFITGYPNGPDGQDRVGAATLWKNLGDVLQKIPNQDNVVVLSDEHMRFSLEGAQFLARAISVLESERPYVTMILGADLFSTNGAHRRLRKGRENRTAQEVYPIAFRVCAELTHYELSDVSATYFVSAAAIQTDPEKPVMKRPSHQTIYINDAIMGLRRITPDHDSGWLASSAIAVWDDENRRHHVVSLG